MAFLNALPGAIAEGLIWGLMAIGVYISYKILDIADLSVDGSICTGGCVFAMLLAGGTPVWLSLLIALIAGALFSILNIVAFSEGVIALEGLNPKGIILFLLAFFAIVRLKASPVLTMLACGGINLIYELVMRAV